MLAAGLGVAAVFASVAAVNAVAAFCICRLLPDELLKSLFAIPLRLAFRVQVNGLDNCRKAGPRAVIVANHVSFLDGVLLAVFLPGHPVFAVGTYIARSEEHTSELQSLMRNSYAVFCLKKKQTHVLTQYMTTHRISL